MIDIKVLEELVKYQEKYPKKYNLVILSKDSFKMSEKVSLKDVLKTSIALIGFFSLLAIASFSFGYLISLILRGLMNIH